MFWPLSSFHIPQTIGRMTARSHLQPLGDPVQCHRRFIRNHLAILTFSVSPYRRRSNSHEHRFRRRNSLDINIF
jgi:hypothetical protein